MIVHSLKAEGFDASEDGTGRGTPIVPVMACKDHGADAGKVSPTLRSMEFDGSHANGGGQVAVAFAHNQDMSVHEERSPSVTGSHGGAPAVAFTERTRADGRSLETQEELAYALCNPGSGGRTHSRQIAHKMAVRRLTPTECERLQGFPDNWTLIQYRGKPAADSCRYRALGNSMAVPVMSWLARRIQLVDSIQRSDQIPADQTRGEAPVEGRSLLRYRNGSDGRFCRL